MSSGIAQDEAVAEVQHLYDNLRRSALAGYAQGVVVPDYAGHGLDEICPIVQVGMPWDPEDAADASPFTPSQIREDVGFLVVEMRPEKPPIVLCPGATPEMREDHRIEVTIAGPTKRGPKRPRIIAGALSMIYRFATVPAPPGIDRIRNLNPPSELPVFVGDDGTYRYDQWHVVMSRFYRGFPATAA